MPRPIGTRCFFHGITNGLPRMITLHVFLCGGEKMQKTLKRISCLICLSVTALLCLLVYGFLTVPESFTQSETETRPRSIYTLTPMTVKETGGGETTQEYNALIKLFRTIPVKRARLTVSTRTEAVAGGGIFGLRLFTAGVIVVETETIETEQGSVSPAKPAGLQPGDVILSLNGEPVRSHTQFSALLADAEDTALQVVYQRDGRQRETTFRAAYSTVYDRYMAGLWVRDSAAGIGTMTFYLPENGIYAGLGHAVCDVDTGEVLPMYEGDIVAAAIHGCKKGVAGQAGELRGSFAGDRIGSLLLNEADGVYGVLDSFDVNAAPVDVAFPDEVTPGSAQMISTIDDSGPQTFEVEIEKVTPRDAEGRNMVIRVTDDRLLLRTGGIVQGMSGSPILQNGRLAGAITHVFVNDPQRGYAIFAQTMVENCRAIADRKQQAAS